MKDNIENFGDKLIAIRKHYGINITQMSDTTGVVKSNISRYEHDLVRPTVYYLDVLVKHYRVNLNWLFGVEQQMILDTKLPEKIKKTNKVIHLEPESYIKAGIPVYGKINRTKNNILPVSGAISAGEPLEIKENEREDYVPFPLSKDKADITNYLVFQVNGLSMAPDIKHEDIVYIKKNDNWLELNGKIVAVMIKGEMTLKKLVIEEANQIVKFKPLNRGYNDIIIDFDMMEGTFLVGELKAIRRVYKK
jgi:SOS-response transcriptional repressor LexA